jgi:hypothetical protein
MLNPTMRAAIGGAWSTHWALWTGLLPVTIIFVMYRQQLLGPPSLWWSLGSAIIQHLAVVVIIVGGGAIARRRRSVLPVPLVVSLWSLASLARAVINYTISASWYSQTSSILYDTLVWLSISAFWVPVAVFAVSQLDQRRLLLAAREVTDDALEIERSESSATAQQLQARVLATVTAHLMPVLADLESSLNAARRRLTGETAAEISLRISHVHDETAELVEREEDVTTLLAGSPPSARAERVTFRRAFSIDTVPPARSASLVVVATLIALLPDTVMIHGTVVALQVAGAVILSGALMALLPGLLDRRAAWARPLTHLRAAALIQALSVGSAAATLAVIAPSMWTGPQWAVVPVTLLALTLAHSSYSTAFIVADANAADGAALSATTAEVNKLRARRLARSKQARERMAQLIHGPIQGRLAACVMALNFHAEMVTSDPDRADSMLDSVMAHLHGVSDELQRLGSAGTSAVADDPSSGVATEVDTPLR